MPLYIPNLHSNIVILVQYQLSQLCNSNFSLLSLSLLLPSRPRDNSCSSGPVQCCNTVESAQQAQGILGALGIIIGDIAGQVGLGCAPVSIFGASGGQCSTNTVCCEDNSNSLISLGCVPITL
ncbi:hydrophobin 2 [Mycena floridula]|nr:hydrophobin 2 [Mycena floridula]